MATPDDNLSSFLRAFDGVQAPEWSDVDDLSRISRIASVRAHAAAVGEVTPAQGSLRLTGAGVDEHRASLAATGAVMTLTQRLVTNIGAALEGVNTLVGRLSSELVTRTQLSLVASPAPGSVHLNLVPSAGERPIDATGGQATLIPADDLLVDRSLQALLSIMQTANNASGVGDDIAREIEELGPRVASTIKTWTKLLTDEHFDTEVAWEGTDSTRRAVTISRQTSAFVNQVVTGRQLDAQPVELIGTVRTVSDVASWALDQDDVESGETRLRVSASKLAPTEVTKVRVGSRVRIAALMQETVRPGHEPRLTYTAISVTLLEDK